MVHSNFAEVGFLSAAVGPFRRYLNLPFRSNFGVRDKRKLAAILRDGVIIAAQGEPAAGAPGIKFADFADPITGTGADGHRQDLFHARITGPGVNSKNNEGIWAYKNTEPALHLIVRKGAEAPGAGGAKFKRFINVSLMPARGPLFTAELLSEGAQPKAARNLGLWATDRFGTLHLLLRTGDPMDGRTLRSFQVLEVISGSTAQQRAWSPDVPGTIVSRCFFNDGTDAVLLLKVP